MMGRPEIKKFRKNKILNSTIAWMNGEKTIYAVKKEAGVDFGTAKKYLKLYSEAITRNEQDIIKKLSKPDTPNKDIPIWQKIKTQILSSILMAR